MTGGHGFLGRRVVRQAIAGGWHTIAPPSAQLDVRDTAAVAEAVSSAGVDTVVHLAYRRTERDTIVEGSRAVASACTSSGARLVHLSTDVVFGGRSEAYTEADSPHPVESYGEAKAAAEHAVAVACPGAVLVRTSLLLGDASDPGQPQLDVIAALTGERPFTFFTDEVRNPAAADDVAAAVLTLAGPLHELSGPLHVAGAEALTRFELAVRIAIGFGLDPGGVQGASLAAAGFEGRRPGRVVLDSSCAAAHGIVCHAV